jgi:23S rRNA (pseudouridine1915-N3)-methyltransferase
VGGRGKHSAVHRSAAGRILMNLTLLCVGRTREGFIREGIEKYLRYLRPYATVAVREVREEKVRDLKEAPLVRRREGERIAKVLAPGARVVALDERGKEFTSHEFAEYLNNARESGVRKMVFVIGGSLGLDESVIDKAHTVLALSRWTVTHELARVVLLEQFYRAFTIITGKTYHY